MFPSFFGTRDQFCGRQSFYRLGEVGGLIGDDLLYFHYHYINFTLDHQTLDPGGWGPLN